MDNKIEEKDNRIVKINRNS